MKKGEANAKNSATEVCCVGMLSISPNLPIKNCLSVVNSNSEMHVHSVLRRAWCSDTNRNF